MLRVKNIEWPIIFQICFFIRYRLIPHNHHILHSRPNPLSPLSLRCRPLWSRRWRCIISSMLNQSRSTRKRGQMTRISANTMRLGIGMTGRAGGTGDHLGGQETSHGQGELKNFQLRNIYL